MAINTAESEQYMRSIIGLREFIEKHLPGVLASRQSLHGYFTTYRQIRNHPPGEVDTGKAGLKIRISEGGSTSFVATLMLWGFDDRQPIEEETREHLASAVDGSGIPTEDGDFLVVIYAGYTAFQETLEFVEGVRTTCPSATIVLVTCDCDLTGKNDILRPRLESGMINFATCCEDCGGRDGMAAVLDAVITQWQPTETSA